MIRRRSVQAARLLALLALLCTQASPAATVAQLEKQIDLLKKRMTAVERTLSGNLTNAQVAGTYRLMMYGRDDSLLTELGWVAIGTLVLNSNGTFSLTEGSVDVGVDYTGDLFTRDVDNNYFWNPAAGAIAPQAIATEAIDTFSGTWTYSGGELDLQGESGIGFPATLQHAAGGRLFVTMTVAPQSVPGQSTETLYMLVKVSP